MSLPRRSAVRSARARRTALLAALVLPLACESTEPEAPSGPAALQPGSVPASAPVAGRVPVTVKVVDGKGGPLAGVAVTWRVVSGGGSVVDAVASDTQGSASAVWVLGTKAGPQSIAASATGVSEQTLSIQAVAGPPETVVVTPSSIALSPSDTLRLTAAAQDAYGNDVQSSSAPEWSVTDTRYATVSAAGTLRALTLGSTSVSARIGTRSGSRAVTVQVGAPAVTTNATPSVTSTFIRFWSDIRPRGANTRMWYDYGTSPTLSTSSLSPDYTVTDQGINGAFSFWASIGNATPNTVYYYRVVAENSAGRSVGAIRSISTSASSGTDLLVRTGLSGAQGGSSRVDFDVPSGTGRLEITASGTGDLGLYVRYNQPAERTANNCFTTTSSGYEVCYFDNPTAGHWYVLIYGHGAYSNTSVRARATTAPSAQVTVSVSPSSATLTVGQTQQLTATVSGSANSSVVWSSSDGSVASVDATGLVTARAVGQATIRATSVADGSKSATSTITVQSSGGGGTGGFDGTWVGRYTGTVSGLGAVTDVAIFRVSGTTLTMTEPGPGSGTVNSAGALTVNATISGMGCQFTGTLTQTGTASGGWTCTTGGSGSGTWTALKNTTNAYIQNGVWIYLSWPSAATGSPTDRQSTADPSLTSATHCPPTSMTFTKAFVNSSQTSAYIRVNTGCSAPPPVWACVGAGSATQPAFNGPALVQCATDPLLTAGTQLRRDALTATAPGEVIILYQTTPQLDLKVFYCKAGTVLVAPPRSVRMICV